MRRLQRWLEMFFLVSKFSLLTTKLYKKTNFLINISMRLLF